MARFAEAESRLFKVKICLKCATKNPWSAEHCRRCGYPKLRPKKLKFGKRAK